jgi:hypothetical protein
VAFVVPVPATTRAQRLKSFFGVVGMDKVLKPVGQEAGFVVPEQFAHRAVDDPEGAVQIGQGNADRGGPHHGVD